MSVCTQIIHNVCFLPSPVAVLGPRMKEAGWGTAGGEGGKGGGEEPDTEKETRVAGPC